MMSAPGKIYWNQDTTERLIILYRDNPILWKTSLPEYRDRERRYAALNEIVTEMRALVPEITIEDIKRKINGLRTQFTKERSKISAEAAYDDGSAPRWYFYELLRFLEAQVSQRKSFPGGHEEEPGFAHLVKEEIEEEYSSEEECHSKPSSTGSNNGSSSSATHKVYMGDELYASSRKRVRGEEESSPHVLENGDVEMNPTSFETLARLCRKLDEMRETDDDIFGKHVACELKRIRMEETKMLAKLKIQAVLYEAYMGNLRDGGT